MKYQMDNGSIVDTAKAKQYWEEDTNWNGNNHISVNTGSQWTHEKLYLSSKGNYYLEHTSQWQSSLPRAEYISEEEAARWLLRNDHELPEELEKFAEEITE